MTPLEIIKAVAEQSIGQGYKILAYLGIDDIESAMSEREFAPPGCNCDKPRARMSDPKNGKGGSNDSCKCFKKNGWYDYVGMVAAIKGINNTEAAKEVASVIGYEIPKQPGEASQKDPAQGLKLDVFNPVSVLGYLKAKPGITLEGLKKLSPQTGQKLKKRVICFPVYSSIAGTKKPPVNYISAPADGSTFQWTKNGEISENKIITQKGGKNGLVGSVEHIDRLTGGNVNGYRILITAGPGDLAAAHSSGIPDDIIAITQAFGERGIPSNKDNGSSHIVDLLASTRCEILIAYDIDDAGKEAGPKLANHFAKRGCTVRAIDLARLELPGKDIRDFIAAGATMTQILALAESTEPTVATEETKTGDRKLIEWTDNELTLVENTVEAISDSDSIYQRAGKLLDVVEGPHPQDKNEKTLTIWDFERSNLRTLITSKVRYFKIADDGQKKFKTIENTFVEQVLKHRRYPRVRNLVGINNHPFLRPSGTACTTDGYDQETGVFLRSTVEINTPDEPTIEDAKAAASRLLAIVQQFDFKEPSHRSSWLASLLTVFARPAIRGPVPLFIVEASQQGSGKTRLVDIVSMIAVGRLLVRGTWDGKEQENAKAMLSVLMSGVSLVLYDNVKSRIGGDTLEAIATGETYAGRILGETRHTPELPIRQVFFFTANNCVITTDVARRACFVRLEPDTDDPASRSFLIDDILGYTRERRSQFASDAITILRAFILAKPKVELVNWGGFEAWSDMVRAAIVWIGEADPYQSTSDKKQSVIAEDVFPELFHAMIGAHGYAITNSADDANGVTSKDVHQAAKQQTGYGEYVNQDLRDALHTACGDKNLTPVRVGQILHRFDGKVIRFNEDHDGEKKELVKRFFSRMNTNKKIKTWHIVDVVAGVESLAGVDICTPPHATPATLSPENTEGNIFAGVAGVSLEVSHKEVDRSEIFQSHSAYMADATFDPRNTRTPAKHVSEVEL